MPRTDLDGMRSLPKGLNSLVRNGSRSRLLRGSAASAVMQVAEVASKFLFNIVLARVAGAAGTGVFYVAFSLATLAAVVGRLGQDRSVLRHVPALLAQQRTAEARSVAVRGLWITLLCSVTVTSLVIAASMFVVRLLGESRELTTSIRILALTIVPLALLNVIASVLRALSRIWASQFVLSASWPLLACAGLLVLGAASTSRSIAWVQFAAISLTALLAFAYLAWLAGPKAEPQARFPYAALLGSGREMCLVVLLNTGLQWLPTLLLGLFVAASQVGVFAMTNRIAMLAAFAPTAVNWMAAPMIAAAHGKADAKRVERLAQRATCLSMAFGLPIVVLLFVAPELILSVFGSEFIEGRHILQVLAFGYAVSIVAGPVGIVLNMTGCERELRKNSLTAFVVTTVAAFALMPWLGGLGAGIAVAAGMTVQNVLGAASVWKKLHLRTVPVSLAPLLHSR